MLAREPKLKGANIIVGVSNLDGSVSLSGSVASSGQEKLAMRLAQGHAKNAKIVNQLRVQRSEAVVNKKKQLPAPGKR